MNLVAAYIGDGYLYGAAPFEHGSDSATTRYSPYWQDLRLEHEPFELVELKDVPRDIAENLLAAGTSDQVYSDGYEAARVAAKYAGDTLDSWAPEERDEDDEGGDDEDDESEASEGGSKAYVLHFLPYTDEEFPGTQHTEFEKFDSAQSAIKFLNPWMVQGLVKKAELHYPDGRVVDLVDDGDWVVGSNASEGIAPTRLKVINSHVGLSRFLTETSDVIGEIPRIRSIRSPYASSPVHPVYEWDGKMVFVVETRHKHYEVFEVPPGTKILPPE